MHKTLNSFLLAGVSALVTLSIGASFSAASSTAPRASQSFNPCAHGYEGTADRVLTLAQDMASAVDSGMSGFRQELGLSLWPEDSVATSSDSTLCTRLDSLIATWISTPEAIALGLVRDSAWHGISAARVNPREYLVSPPLLVDGLVWYFVVDSLDGDVRYFKTKW